jgi:hypothetical protein
MKAYLTAHAPQIGAMARTLFLTFGLAFMGIVVTFPTILASNGGDWKVAANAGLVAVAKLAFNWFDAGYQRYGISKV